MAWGSGPRPAVWILLLGSPFPSVRPPGRLACFVLFAQTSVCRQRLQCWARSAGSPSADRPAFFVGAALGGGRGGLGPPPCRAIRVAPQQVWSQHGCLRCGVIFKVNLPGLGRELALSFPRAPSLHEVWF